MDTSPAHRSMSATSSSCSRSSSVLVFTKEFYHSTVMTPAAGCSVGQENLFLPKGFSPSPNDVMVGRGKRIVAHNKRFYKLIESEQKAYSAGNKTVKSRILVRVLEHVKQVVKGRFVKMDKVTGRWLAVEDGSARMIIAQAFRDALDTSYRSSKKFKKKRRLRAKGLSSSPSSPISITTAFACAQTQVVSVEEEANNGVHLPFLGIRPIKQASISDDSLIVPPNKAATDIMANQSPATNLLSHDATEEKLYSLDGLFSASEVAAACECDFLVLSSVFDQKI